MKGYSRKLAHRDFHPGTDMNSVEFAKFKIQQEQGDCMEYVPLITGNGAYYYTDATISPQYAEALGLQGGPYSICIIPHTKHSNRAYRDFFPTNLTFPLRDINMNPVRGADDPEVYKYNLAMGNRSTVLIGSEGQFNLTEAYVRYLSNLGPNTKPSQRLSFDQFIKITTLGTDKDFRATTVQTGEVQYFLAEPFPVVVTLPGTVLKFNILSDGSWDLPYTIVPPYTGDGHPAIHASRLFNIFINSIQLPSVEFQNVKANNLHLAEIETDPSMIPSIGMVILAFFLLIKYKWGDKIDALISKIPSKS